MSPWRPPSVCFPLSPFWTGFSTLIFQSPRAISEPYLCPQLPISAWLFLFHSLGFTLLLFLFWPPLCIQTVSFSPVNQSSSHWEDLVVSSQSDHTVNPLQPLRRPINQVTECKLRLCRDAHGSWTPKLIFFLILGVCSCLSHPLCIPLCPSDCLSSGFLGPPLTIFLARSPPPLRFRMECLLQGTGPPASPSSPGILPSTFLPDWLIIAQSIKSGRPVPIWLHHLPWGAYASPQFPSLQNGDNNIHLKGLLWTSSEVTWKKNVRPSTGTWQGLNWY